MRRVQRMLVDRRSLKPLIQPAYLARVVFWLAFVVAIFMGHEHDDNKGQLRDGARKAHWLNNSLKYQLIPVTYVTKLTF